MYQQVPQQMMAAPQTGKRNRQAIYQQEPQPVYYQPQPQQVVYAQQPQMVYTQPQGRRANMYDSY